MTSARDRSNILVPRDPTGLISPRRHDSSRQRDKNYLVKRLGLTSLVYSSLVPMIATGCTGDTNDLTANTSQALTIVNGDINGDGRADIALTGGTNWTTMPVAYSAGDGSFTVSNQPVGDFAVFAQQGGRALVGDFDGDGRNDVALIGGSIPTTGKRWNTIPIAFSNGDGTFRVTNKNVGDFAAFAMQGDAGHRGLQWGRARGHRAHRRFYPGHVEPLEYDPGRIFER